MRTTEQYTIHNVIQMIESGEIKIPILQRPYVWRKEQVEKLFSTVFQDNPFDAISTIKTADNYPIFASRTFIDDLKDKFDLSYNNDGEIHTKDNPLYLILDGQQRLQSFYLGLTSKYDGTELCFNKHDGSFKYLDTYNNNDYISVKKLYKKLETTPYEQVAKIYNQENDEDINKNIFKFYYHIYFKRHVVFLISTPSLEESEDRKRFVDLFISLNTAGTPLTKWETYLCSIQGLKPETTDLFTKLIVFAHQISSANIKFDDRNYKNFQDFCFNAFLNIIYFCLLNNTRNDNCNNVLDIINSIADYWFYNDYEKIKNLIINKINIEDINLLPHFIEEYFLLHKIIPKSIENSDLIVYLYREYKTNTKSFNIRISFINYLSNTLQRFFNYEDDKKILLYYILIKEIKTYDSYFHSFSFAVKKIDDSKSLFYLNKKTNDANLTVLLNSTLDEFYYSGKELIPLEQNHKLILEENEDTKRKELTELQQQFEQLWQEKENEWNKLINHK